MRMIRASILLTRLSRRVLNTGINVAINATAPRMIKTKLLERFESLPV